LRIRTDGHSSSISSTPEVYPILRRPEELFMVVIAQRLATPLTRSHGCAPRYEDDCGAPGACCFGAAGCCPRLGLRRVANAVAARWSASATQAE
jgi:hypothetical protein